MNVAVILWNVIKLELLSLGSTLLPGEQEGYRNTMSDNTIRKNEEIRWDNKSFSAPLKRNQ